ncbi:ArsR family transcriptional regulator [Corallococcus praedator]|uniref:ArsR family transcriptional regulator n=2 Tax=Corallococcus praedator TaxID=2316724 RepID=A0ABX9Q8N5_9BACT|nr:MULTISPECIES: metalloregulator ArsR/SmtB family transcription factor [Corallococcus]RKH08934.1 ArsR family transcriptional regulator [Corallococcus sp. CA047B]RKH18537.1 ArsR family transcriptional regulator [Corallococcus sp. CA031C]RKH91778.1 ArsR family transcriptional regulator [Corallococcus praedator]
MPASTPLDVRPLSRALKALGDETRLRIVALLSHSELCVCHLESVLSLPQSNTSRHLSVLKAAGLVEARREGSWVYYRLAPQLDELCGSQVRALVDAFAKRDVLRREVARVLKSCGPDACK